MEIKINSMNSFKGNLTANIVLKNADKTQRLKNIIREYSKFTEEAPYKNLKITQEYNPEAEGVLLNIKGKDTFITNNLIEDYMHIMTDTQIAKKLVKIADYLQLKHQKNNICKKYLVKLFDLEGLIRTNEQKADVLRKHGKDKFADQFAKITELNKKTADKLRLERDKAIDEIDNKMIQAADGDKEILADMVTS